MSVKRLVVATRMALAELGQAWLDRNWRRGRQALLERRIREGG